MVCILYVHTYIECVIRIQELYGVYCVGAYVHTFLHVQLLYGVYYLCTYCTYVHIQVLYGVCYVRTYVDTYPSFIWHVMYTHTQLLYGVCYVDYCCCCLVGCQKGISLYLPEFVPYLFQCLSDNRVRFLIIATPLSPPSQHCYQHHTTVTNTMLPSHHCHQHLITITPLSPPSPPHHCHHHITITNTMSTPHHCHQHHVTTVTITTTSLSPPYHCHHCHHRHHITVTTTPLSPSPPHHCHHHTTVTTITHHITVTTITITILPPPLPGSGAVHHLLDTQQIRSLDRQPVSQGIPSEIAH